MILVGVGNSVAEVGMLETGAAGAQAVETAVPVALTVVAVGLGSVLLLVTGMLLRPRLMRRLSQPALRPIVVAGTAGAGKGTAGGAADPAPTGRGNTQGAPPAPLPAPPPGCG